MKHYKLHYLALLAILLLLGTACGSAESATAENPTQAENEENTDDGHDDGDEHYEADMAMEHAHVEAPEEFASLANPFAADHEAVETGEELFQAYCASCHGPGGQGDGPAAETLDPKPATLADGAMMNDLSDGYLYWRVSLGGQMDPFNSAMPAWEAALSEEQRWQIISFVRSLASESDGRMEDEHMEEGEHIEEDEHMEEDNE